MKTPAPVLDAYGEWIAGLTPWTHFVTLTHRLPGDVGAEPAQRAQPRGYTRVGVQRHRRAVRAWFHEQVRAMDPGARWWSEMEFHASGVPHEHGLIALGERAPALSMRQAWYESRGYARFDAIGSRFAVARYVAKYSGKAAAFEPCVWGFGLLAAPSFSVTMRAAAPEARW